MAKGTFYWYFDSKNQVVNAVVESVVNDICGVLEVITRSEGSVLSKLGCILNVFLERVSGQCELLKYFHKEENSQFHDRIAHELKSRLAPLLIQLINEGMVEGIWSTDYPEEAAAFVLASFSAIHDDVFLQNEFSSKRISRFFHFVLKGLGYNGPAFDPGVLIKGGQRDGS